MEVKSVSLAKVEDGVRVVFVLPREAENNILAILSGLEVVLRQHTLPVEMPAKEAKRRCRVTNDMIEKIRKMRDEGYSISQTSRTCGCSENTVYKYQKRHKPCVFCKSATASHACADCVAVAKEYGLNV